VKLRHVFLGRAGRAAGPTVDSFVNLRVEDGMGQWIPINPNLDPGGAFAALAHLPGGGALKPMPLDAGQDAFGTWWEQSSTLSVSAASRLGISSLVDSSSSMKSQTLTYDVALYGEVIAPVPIGGLIYGTRWGAGIRTRITVFDAESKTNMKLSSVAASTSLGLCNATYQVEGLGITSPSLLGLLPGPGRFDANGHAQLTAAIRAVVDNILKPKQSLTAVPFMIFVSNAAFFANPIERARSFLHGVRSIAWQSDLKGALDKAERILDPIAIRTAYEHLAPGTADTAHPPANSIEQAKAWMRRAGMPK
jgi:hypothetical protein